MQIRFERNRTNTIVVMYSLYLYSLGLSLRNTSKALVIFKDNKRSHVSVWNWIQRFADYPIYKRKRISFYIDRKQSNRICDGDNKFKTTEKGLNFLKMHNQIEELLLTTIKNN